MSDKEKDTYRFKPIPKNKRKNKDKKSIVSDSDGFTKKSLSNKTAARDFLEYYLPEKYKSILDLSKITVEKESHIENDLTKRFNDIIYSVNTTKGEKAYIYALLEQQSSVDYFITYRLLRYTLLVLEQYTQTNSKKVKFPLVIPLLIYNGSKKHDAHMEFWQLFDNPELAKEAIAGKYNIIDLQAMDDKDIIKQKNVGLVQFMLKHIHMRDMIKLWERIIKEFDVKTIIQDKDFGFLYFSMFLHYTDMKVPADKKAELNKLILDHLKEDGQKLMYSIADSYIDEGIAKGKSLGLEEGLKEGLKEGLAKGEYQEKLNIAQKMVNENVDINFISKITNLPIETVRKLPKQK